MNDSLIKRKRITRIACIIALLLVVVMAGAHGVFAADIIDSGTCGSNLTWTLDSDGVLTIEGSGSMKDYEPLWHGRNYAPWDTDLIKSVVINDGMISIGDYAFDGCSSLTSITIPDSITSLGNSAFSGCSSLTSITIPDSITSIGNRVFSGCSSLTSITIPDSITSLGDYAFSGCNGLNSLVIPNSVTSVGVNAFGGLSLVCVEFLGDAPGIEGVVSTSDNTWNKNGSRIYNGPLFVVPKDKSGWTTPLWNGYRTAYKGLSPEDNSTLNPDNCNNNGAEFVLDEASLTASMVGFLGNESGILSVPARVTKDGTRYTVTGISDIIYKNMPDPVVLSKIIIGKNISSISKDALDDLADAEILEMAADNDSFKVDKGVLYNYDKTEVIRVLRNSTQISISSSVTTICENAFSKCEKLKSVSIPNGVNIIEANAFNGCTSLTTISLPKSLTTIGYCAFEDCISLKDLLIPNNVTSLGYAMFSKCTSLETITLPFVTGATKYGTNDKVWNPRYLSPLGYYFGQDNGDGLSKIEQYFKYGEPYESDFSQFGVTSTTYSIPTSLRSVTVTGGSLYYGAFYNCNMIEEITLGKDVEFTGERAFYGCSSLERINVSKKNPELASDSNGVLYSKDYKTIKCYPSGKKNVSYQIDSRVEAIEPFAFYNCLNLESLYVPDSVTEIPTNSIAYYDLTMFVYRGSAAETYAQTEEIAYKYIGETKAKNVRVTSEYGLPVIASGEENASVVGDYDGVSGVVDGAEVNYNAKTSGLQTVTVTYNGETIQTKAVVYDPDKETFHDFGDVVEIDEKTELGIAGMYNAEGRFLGLSPAIVLEEHKTVLIPNEVYEEAVDAKLMVIKKDSFAPAAEAVEEGL